MCEVLYYCLPLPNIFTNRQTRSLEDYTETSFMLQYNINVTLRLISLVSVNINWFNLRIMGNVLGIIGTFLENYQGFFENLRIAF